MRQLKKGPSVSGDLNRQHCRLLAILLVSLALAVGLAGIAHAAGADRLYVVCYNESQYPQGIAVNDTINITNVPYLYKIDTASNRVLTATSLNEPVYSLVISPSGDFLYTAGNLSRNITIRYAANLTVNRTISLNSSVTGLAISYDGAQLYALIPAARAIYSVDTESGIVGAIIPLNITPQELILSPDGRRIYAVDGTNGTAAVIDVPSARQIAIIQAGAHPTGITTSPNGKTVYVANYNNNSISVFDATSFALKSVITNVTAPAYIVTDTQQFWIFVTSASDGNLTQIDAALDGVSAVTQLRGNRLGKPVISSDGLKIFVPEPGDKSVVLLSATSLTRLGAINFTDPAMALVIGPAIDDPDATLVPSFGTTTSPTPKPTIYYPGKWGTPTPFQIPLPIPPRVSIAPMTRNGGLLNYQSWLPPFRPLTTGDVVIVVLIYFIVLIVLAGITYVMMFKPEDDDEDDDR